MSLYLTGLTGFFFHGFGHSLFERCSVRSVFHHVRGKYDTEMEPDWFSQLLTKAWTLRRGVWIWKETLQDFGDLQKFENSKMELGSEMADYKTPLSKSVLLLAFYYPSGLN